jgi:hypothetical protein
VTVTRTGSREAATAAPNVPSSSTAPSGGVPFVSIVIPVRNDAARLQRCLASIAHTTYPSDRFEILVADNGSTDASPEVARNAGASVLRFPDIRVSEVRNRAATIARGDVLVFVDADHELDLHWIPHAIETLVSSGAAAVGAGYYAPEDGTWVQKMYDSFRLRTPGLRQVDWLGSGSLAVWRNTFRDLGGFDIRLETCEDVDFCQRLRMKRYVLFSDDRLRSVHLGDPRTLRALFFGELWRGRDNLRVSLRGPVTLRALPSIFIPVTLLVMLAAIPIALVVEPAWLVLAVAGGGILLLTILRVVRMLMHMRRCTPVLIARAWLVAIVYEVARALALVARTPHGVRQAASLSGRLAHRGKP